MPYVFGSVLACAKSAHVFQKLSYLLCWLCPSFLANNSSSDNKAFRCYIAFSSSPTAVHFAFYFFDVKAWPQSQTDFFRCTTVLHCGHTFIRCIDLLHSIACTTVLHCGHTFLNLCGHALLLQLPLYAYLLQRGLRKHCTWRKWLT